MLTMKFEAVSRVLLRVLTICLAACSCRASSALESCGAFEEGAMVITEIMASPAGGAADFEYVELFNRGETAISFEGLRLSVQSENGTPSTLVLAPDLIDPGQYFVVAKGPEAQAASWANRLYGDRFPSLPATAGRVALRCGERMIDEVYWRQSISRGHSRMLHPGALDPLANDNDAAWCQAPDTFSYDGLNYGTPGTMNTGCPSQVAPGYCLEQGRVRAQRPPAVGEVWVSELMAAPVSHPLSSGEWMEIAAHSSVDLNGLELVVNGRSATVASDDCLTVSKETPGVIGSQSSRVAFDGLVARVPMVLPNAGGQWQLRLKGLTLDEGSFGPSSGGVALQLSTDEGSADDNNQPSDFCKAVPTFNEAMERGSPGRPNPSCEVLLDAGLPVDECVDALTGLPRKIREIQDASVYVSEVMANPSAVDDSLGEYIEIGTREAVDLNGISLWHNEVEGVRFESPNCLSVDANSLLVLARNADAAKNGGIEGVELTFPFSLRNDLASGQKKLELRAFDRVLEKVEYVTPSMPGEAGTSWQRQAGSEPPNEAKWCQPPASLRFGNAQTGDRGTPGKANVCRSPSPR
jgi:Lamin Tail Domain